MASYGDIFALEILFGRHRYRWEDNIKINIIEIVRDS
jgi:hypothetical protein